MARLYTPAAGEDTTSPAASDPTQPAGVGMAAPTTLDTPYNDIYAPLRQNKGPGFGSGMPGMSNDIKPMSTNQQSPFGQLPGLAQGWGQQPYEIQPLQLPEMGQQLTQPQQIGQQQMQPLQQGFGGGSGGFNNQNMQGLMQMLSQIFSQFR
jgi:hypothetical protein